MLLVSRLEGGEMTLLIGLGWTELLMITAAFGTGLVPLIGAIDAALKPESAWQAANQNKLVWVLLQALSIFLSCLGLIVPIIYFVSIRPKVVSNLP